MRTSGLLAHITSLPSPYGLGDFGPGACAFADFLVDTRQSFWQVLPLNPVNPGCGYSPYSGLSAFAWNELLVSPDLLWEEGYLDKADLEQAPRFPEERCLFDEAAAAKKQWLDKAFERFSRKKDRKAEFREYCEANTSWLDDYAQFIVFKDMFGGRSWMEWPREFRDRSPGALNSLAGEGKTRLDRVKFGQYEAGRQWMALRDHCNRKNIRIIGDIPIYVSLDSADVWSEPGMFKLDSEKRPTHVAGVPPDYFSRTGQLWGNPVYDWERLRETGYSWWLRRLERNFSLYGRVRLDHFRGLVAYWEVPAGEQTAMNGRWVNVPARDFLDTLRMRFPVLPIIAEDLGLITEDVLQVVEDYGLPGMRVLQFAFKEDRPDHPYLPHNFPRNCVVYTGTHDNNTTRGWFERELDEAGRRRLKDYLGKDVSADTVHWEMIRLALASVADTAIVPMQDVLGLGEEARMNRPSETQSNWEWRFSREQIGAGGADTLRRLTELYGRG